MATAASLRIVKWKGRRSISRNLAAMAIPADMMMTLKVIRTATITETVAPLSMTFLEGVK